MRRRPKPYFIFLLFFILVALVAGGRLLIQAIPDRPPAPSAEEPGSLRVLEGGADVLYRVRYKQCGHLEPLGGGKEPISFFNLSGLSQPELQALLPEGWGTVDFSPGKVVLENSATGLCSVCREKMYLGVRGDRIAIFPGRTADRHPGADY